MKVQIFENGRRYEWQLIIRTHTVKVMVTVCRKLIRFYLVHLHHPSNPYPSNFFPSIPDSALFGDFSLRTILLADNQDNLWVREINQICGGKKNSGTEKRIWPIVYEIQCIGVQGRGQLSDNLVSGLPTTTTKVLLKKRTCNPYRFASSSKGERTLFHWVLGWYQESGSCSRPFRRRTVSQ